MVVLSIRKKKEYHMVAATKNPVSVTSPMVLPSNEGDSHWENIGKLSEPFSQGEIKSYSAKGQTMRYIDARQVMERLDSVIGPQNWYDDYYVVDESTKAVSCQLTINGITKSDIGYPNAGADADDANKEPLKAAYSDAFKRAAVKWGVGRHLYGSPTPPKPVNPLHQKVDAIWTGADPAKKDRVKQYLVDNVKEPMRSVADIKALPDEVLEPALSA